CADEGELLPHALRVLAKTPVEGLLQPEARGERTGTPAARHRVQPVQLAKEVQVLVAPHAQVQAVILREHADARADLVRLLDDVITSHTRPARSEEHTSELQSRENIVCRLLLE